MSHNSIVDIKVNYLADINPDNDVYLVCLSFNDNCEIYVSTTEFKRIISLMGYQLIYHKIKYGNIPEHLLKQVAELDIDTTLLPEKDDMILDIIVLNYVITAKYIDTFSENICIHILDTSDPNGSFNIHYNIYNFLDKIHNILQNMDCILDKVKKERELIKGAS